MFRPWDFIQSKIDNGSDKEIFFLDSLRGVSGQLIFSEEWYIETYES